MLVAFEEVAAGQADFVGEETVEYGEEDNFGQADAQVGGANVGSVGVLLVEMGEGTPVVEVVKGVINGAYDVCVFAEHEG